MIRQQVGDLLEIEYEGRHYYVVVLTKIVLFGGNVVFAFHTDGSPRAVDDLRATDGGFNVCTDLLMPKKEGRVRRLAKLDDLDPYWRTRYAKLTNEYRPGRRAKQWSIYRIEDPSEPIAVRRWMPRKYREAMDYAMYSFDLVAERILHAYTPEQNPHL